MKYLCLKQEFALEKKLHISKKLIDKVSSKWIKNTDHNTNILFWSYKAFIEEKVKNFDEAFKCFEKAN